MQDGRFFAVAGEGNRVYCGESVTGSPEHFSVMAMKTTKRVVGPCLRCKSSEVIIANDVSSLLLIAKFCKSSGSTLLKTTSMGIIRYIPKQSSLKDHRGPQGGYYEAVCACGTRFYPKRSDALYCSNRCTALAYRERKQAEKLRKAEERQRKLEWALAMVERFKP